MECLANELLNFKLIAPIVCVISKKKTLECINPNYYLTYVFSSRIWNDSMQKTIVSVKSYEIILLESQIWDLTRYGSDSRKLYLQNMDKCFSKLKLMNKIILWITTPPVNDIKHPILNNLLLMANSLIITKAREYGFHVIDLNEYFKNYLHLCGTDGIH
ncbi:unnamed protein product [Rotaria sp. Silwood2]|nr:unnamed protein product [Rotaria sp. Silwood2]CAF4285807.1 unnamed protein product [Rotaria sp. Silwood2]